MKIITTMFSLILIILSPILVAEENASDQSSSEETVQEIKYVTDKLRLSLYKQPDSKSGTIKLLVSGDVLDVLAISGPYSKVRTKQGDTGWVKNGFLVPDPTDSYQLIEEQKKNKILSQQLDKYANTQQLVDDYENTISRMNEDQQQLQQDLDQRKLLVEELQQERDGLIEQIEASQQGSLTLDDILFLAKQYWYVLVGIILLLFLFGFIVGKALVESQVRNRFQGVKVW